MCDFEVRVTIGKSVWFRGEKDGSPFGGGDCDGSDEFHANVQSVLLHAANQNQLRLDANYPVGMTDCARSAVEVENEIPRTR
jgi:hypothetical protein